MLDVRFVAAGEENGGKQKELALCVMIVIEKSMNKLILVRSVCRMSPKSRV